MKTISTHTWRTDFIFRTLKKLSSRDKISLIPKHSPTDCSWLCETKMSVCRYKPSQNRPMNKRTPALYTGETINTVEQKQPLYWAGAVVVNPALYYTRAPESYKNTSHSHAFFSGANCFITGPGVRKKMRHKIKLPQDICLAGWLVCKQAASESICRLLLPCWIRKGTIENRLSCGMLSLG